MTGGGDPGSRLPNLPQVTAGKGGIPCLTRRCSACCHDIEMLLTDADLARLGATRPGEDFWFLADDGYLQLRTRAGPPAAGWQGGPLLPVPAGARPRPCVFLDDAGRCSVHDVRPEGCRLYPAVWDDALRGAELDADYCPHTDGFTLDAAATDAVRRLAATLERERRARAGSADAGAGPSNTL